MRCRKEMDVKNTVAMMMESEEDDSNDGGSEQPSFNKGGRLQKKVISLLWYIED